MSNKNTDNTQTKIYQATGNLSRKKGKKKILKRDYFYTKTKFTVIFIDDVNQRIRGKV